MSITCTQLDNTQLEWTRWISPYLFSATTLNSRHSVNLNPHIEILSKRLLIMLSSFTKSKAKANEGVRSTVTVVILNVPLTRMPSNVCLLTSRFWICKKKCFHFWYCSLVTLFSYQIIRHSKLYTSNLHFLYQYYWLSWNLHSQL